MIYLIVKALHLVSVLFFVGGLLAGALLLRMASTSALPASAAIRQALRWHHLVTTAAMFGVWGFGLTLAQTGHWFPAPWLIIKLALVLALSAMQGVISGHLRSGEASSPAFAGLVLPCAGTAVICVVFLAVLKMPSL